MAPKVASKVAPKRKSNVNDDRLSRKVTGPFVGDQQQKSPSPPRHRASKGLITRKGPITPGPVYRLVTHKDYAIEIVNLIIKEIDLDACGELTLEDLGASDLYDRLRICLRQF